MAKTGKRIENADTALKRIKLPSPDIKAWQARLDLPADEVMRCAGVLSHDEKLRADRFHFERDRRRFIVARGTLRRLLGSRLDIEPAAVAFSYSRHGKPSVVGDPQIHFNVSHSEERALYAISSRCQLGVDIEYLNRDVDWHGLSKRFFTGSEFSALQNLEASSRKRAFLACWTRKEAIVKATGDGLSLPLDRFEVTVEPDAAPRLLVATDHRIDDWALYTADVGNDYVATVAAYCG